MKNVRRALQYFLPDRARLVLVFFLMLAGTGINVLKPWPLALIVDSVLGAKPFPKWTPDPLENWSMSAMLATLSGAILLFHFGHGALSAAQNFISIKIGLRGLTRVRNEVFARLQKLSLRFHQGANSGDLIYRASWDTYAFQTLFQQGLITFATAFLSLVLMVFVMAKLNGRLTLAALTLVPLLILVIKIFGNKMSERTALSQQADSKVTSLVQRSIASMQLIQSYTAEVSERERFGREVLTSEKRRISQHGFELSYWFALAIVFGLGATAITWLGAKEVLAGRLSVGELLIFLAYLAQLYEPLNQLSQVGATVSGATAGTRRVFEILDATDEVKERGFKNKNRIEIKGNIEFHNVSFGYEAKREILHELSFSLKAGECVAIVGPSGAGKTSLLNLIPRFFDPTSGLIKLEGINLSDFGLKDLRSQIALVLQQPIILPATIAENISYGKPNATFSEIRNAAHRANADLFIEQMQQKYDTMVGDGAARLSIGEQQRINLARAFLKDAPVLLLDEPTSALDAESESLVLAGLERLIKGRTTLIIAHRFRLIERADRIMVLETGRIVECGTHEELSRRNGYYNRVLRDLRINQQTERSKK